MIASVSRRTRSPRGVRFIGAIGTDKQRIAKRCPQSVQCAAHRFPVKPSHGMWNASRPFLILRRLTPAPVLRRPVYEYREYKNWRGIPKPRRCPFCKQAKGEIRKVRGGFQGYCPSCAAAGLKRESYDEALKIWNGSPKPVQ